MCERLQAAAIEGAVLVSRAQRNLDALDDIQQLFAQLGAGRSRRFPLTDNPALA